MSEETSEAEALLPGWSPALDEPRGMGGWLRNCWLRAWGCWWASRRLTAICWLMRWAMASCWRTSCGDSCGESRPPGPSRGWRAPGGGGGGGGTWPVRSGGLWCRGPWGEGCCWGVGGCWVGWEGTCRSPDPALRRGLLAPWWLSWARPARWGGLWPSMQISAMLSLSTVQKKGVGVFSEHCYICIVSRRFRWVLTFDISSISSRPHLFQVINCSTSKCRKSFRTEAQDVEIHKESNFKPLLINTLNFTHLRKLNGQRQYLLMEGLELIKICKPLIFRQLEINDPHWCIQYTNWILDLTSFTPNLAPY